MKIKHRLSLITIGVQDLQAIRIFYEEKLGWEPAAVNKDIVFLPVKRLFAVIFPAERFGKRCRNRGRRN